MKVCFHLPRDVYASSFFIGPSCLYPFGGGWKDWRREGGQKQTERKHLTCEWLSSNLRTHLIATFEFERLSIALYTFEKAPLRVVGCEMSA